MKQFILTEGGNLLRFHETLKKPYFESPQGEFLRECSMHEFDHLCNLGILCESNDQRLDIEPKFFPTWHFLKSIRVCDDYSNYRPETSNNGGNYSFHTDHDWFIAKFPDGKWKFAFVERYPTSSEFGYDELTGKFQSDLGVIFVQNCQQSITYITQIGRIWDEVNEGWHYQIPEVVEKLGSVSDFNHLWNESFLHIPSNWDEKDVEKRTEGLPMSDKKEIIRKLKELGCDLREGTKRIPKRGFVKNNRR